MANPNDYWFHFLTRKFLLLLDKKRLFNMAIAEDAVPSQLPRPRPVRSGLQPVHAVLHLPHAHVLVSLRVRLHGDRAFLERLALADGAEVCAVRRREYSRVRNTWIGAVSLSTVLVLPGIQRRQERYYARVGVPIASGSLGLLHRNVMRL